jgi:hypothetical protein
MESLMPDLSKKTKAKRIEEVVVTYVWLSHVKPYFVDRVFYLNRDKNNYFYWL